MNFNTSWQDKLWRQQVENWLAAESAALGLGSPTDVRLEKSRPWSIVARVELGEEVAYFKASAPTLRHEAAVTAWLANNYPEVVPEVLALRADRGWMLQQSAGEKWRDAVADEALLARWKELLPVYANLQIHAQTHMRQLKVLGIPDRRPSTLPTHVRRWLDILRDKADTEHGLTSAELSRLAAIQPELEDNCHELAQLRPDCSINHGDLHDANVGQANERTLIFDWGDASLSHPFFSLRSTFVSLENRLGWHEDDPRIVDLSQVYLNSWRDSVSETELQRSYDLAGRLWSLGTALNWEAALASFGNAEAEGYAEVLPSLMRELLAAFGQEIDRPI